MTEGFIWLGLHTYQVKCTCIFFKKRTFLSLGHMGKRDKKQANFPIKAAESSLSLSSILSYILLWQFVTGVSSNNEEWQNSAFQFAEIGLGQYSWMFLFPQWSSFKVMWMLYISSCSIAQYLSNDTKHAMLTIIWTWSLLKLAHRMLWF